MSNVKTVNVYIPFIEIYLQLEVDTNSELSQIAQIIRNVTNNDNELNIFRFKFNGEILSMQTKLKDVSRFQYGDPKCYLTAYAQMCGA